MDFLMAESRVLVRSIHPRKIVPCMKEDRLNCGYDVKGMLRKPLSNHWTFSTFCQHILLLFHDVLCAIKTLHQSIAHSHQHLFESFSILFPIHVHFPCQLIVPFYVHRLMPSNNTGQLLHFLGWIQIL